MNNSKAWQVATISIYIAAAALSAIATPLVHAQQPSNAPKAGNLAPPPPELERLEEGEKPAITIQKNEIKPEEAITQQRQQGAVTDVKVHSGGSTYHLKPKQVGTSMSGDTPSAPVSNPQWVVKEFDWGQKKEKPGQAQAADSKSAPPPPTAPAK